MFYLKNLKSDQDQESDCDWKPSSESESDKEKNISPNDPTDAPSGKIRNNYKKTFCTFCESFVISRHFSRHLQNLHKKKL